MEISPIDERRFLIIAEAQDNNYLPDRICEDHQYHRILTGFIQLCAVKAGYDLRNKRISVKLLFSAEVRILLIQLDEKPKLVPDVTPDIIAVFPDYLTLTDALVALNIINYTENCILYLYKFNMRLTAYITVSSEYFEKFTLILSQFASIYPAREADKLRLDEHGQLLFIK